MYYAHLIEGRDRSRWQALSTHLTGVADMAGAFGKSIGIERAARLAGLLHDLGKYTPTFQARLAGAADRVDHSTAGAAIVRELTETAKFDDKVLAELVAYVIAGHHAGLPDKQGEAVFGATSRRRPCACGCLRTGIFVARNYGAFPAGSSVAGLPA